MLFMVRRLDVSLLIKMRCLLVLEYDGSRILVLQYLEVL